MWPEWLKSPRRSHITPSKPLQSPARSPRYFACSSFKDIQTLLSEEPPNSRSIPEPDSPKSPCIFHRVRIATSLLRNNNRYHSKSPIILSSPPNNDGHAIIVYFTTLRVVRKTFEECRIVRSILRGFRVPIDERDLSMDGRYLDELLKITGSKRVSLPVVFIGGKYVGGADEIKEMNENGELKRLIGGSSSAFGLETNGCNVCGGVRFVLCEHCNGSHKIYTEKYGFRSCTACNSNGLIKCPLCFPVSRRRMSIS